MPGPRWQSASTRGKFRLKTAVKDEEVLWLLIGKQLPPTRNRLTPFWSEQAEAPSMNAKAQGLRLGAHRVHRTVACKASNAKFLVGGNWKCNGTQDSVSKLVSGLNAGSVPGDIDVVVAPVFIHLKQVIDTLDLPIQISAQDCWTGEGGAFTGEVTADMLAELGVPWTITGHSERRALCGETNDIVGEKTAYALTKGLKVIACIGETLPERESGQLWDVLGGQMAALKSHVPAQDWANMVVAYEPIWAIGTGVVATPDQAQVRALPPLHAPQVVPQRVLCCIFLFLVAPSTCAWSCGSRQVGVRDDRVNSADAPQSRVPTSYLPLSITKCPNTCVDDMYGFSCVLTSPCALYPERTTAVRTRWQRQEHPNTVPPAAARRPSWDGSPASYMPFNITAPSTTVLARQCGTSSSSCGCRKCMPGCATGSAATSPRPSRTSSASCMAAR